MAATCFNLETVKEFMINNGGRVTNQQLVTHFKAFLNDPVSKVTHREKFKDFVNELATIKIEENGKILVLKKKHRQPEQSAAPVAAPRTNKNDKLRAQSEPPRAGGGDVSDGGGMSKGRSEEYFDKRPTDSGVDSLAASTSSIASSESQLSQSSHMSHLSTGTASTTEDEINESVISVKDRAKHLNKIESQSDILMPNQFKKKSHSRSAGGDDDDDSHSSGTACITYGPEEKEWMLICASSDYHEMNKLLSKDSSLAKIRDFTNGYTALHWAAKHGKTEVIKLLAARAGVNVNQRSYGGYTPLHLAAMHGHEDIIELLVQSYKADSNIRDYSGKKAKQYLKNSASSRTQQMLLSRRITAPTIKGQSLDDSFMRNTLRKSNRAKAISSLIQAGQSAVHRSRSTLIRSSWGSSSEYVDEEHTPPGSSHSSPATSRKGSFSEGTKDRHLMPPPSAPTQRRNKSASQERLQTQSASSIDPRSLSGSRSESAISSKNTFI